MNELITFDKCKVSKTRLGFVTDMTFEEWESIGVTLSQIDKSMSWWIGDWLNYGEGKFGDKVWQVADRLGLTYEHLANVKSVTKKISCRHEKLSFTHHQEVASLPPEQQEEVLNKAEEEKLNIRETRELVKEIKKLPTPPLPEGKYDVILADPPWSYGDKQNIDSLGGAEKHYPTMSIDELCQLDIPSADNAVLFLWVTSPLLDECWPVIESWGFEYKTSFIWDKVKHNMGHYNSVRHEFLLVCTKGSLTPDNKVLFDSVITEERSDKHSEKPQKVYEIIETIYPNRKYLELFSRNTRKGWKGWGNEL